MSALTLPALSDLAISHVAEASRPSPLARRLPWVDEARRVLLVGDAQRLAQTTARGEPLPSFECAGPRERIAFDPSTLTCGIVTCGGLCPGLNDVIRSIVMTLHHWYGVPKILGFRYGYAGLRKDPPAAPYELTPEMVSRIHDDGGTMLGSSRGQQDLGEMAQTLAERGVGVLFAIGGDGTLRGARALAEEVQRRGLKIAVIGVPKTIDNDLLWIERSFGFLTAVEAARGAIAAAHAEARGAWNGVGLVKLMGRHSGFIAAEATLSNSDVNFCIVPEVRVDLHGEAGFLAALERRLAARHHAVVVVAEGASEQLMPRDDAQGRDKSGNKKLGDVGVFLRDSAKAYFADRGVDMSMKYIDPSYMIRGIHANASDSSFCLALGQHAVHAGMSGRTNMLVGYWNQKFVHLPMTLATSGRRQIDPDGALWHRVVLSTGQPRMCADGNC
ncbi:MAG: ATP-dependent 6-phosphofructokinase [Myxococcota bacterium]